MNLAEQFESRLTHGWGYDKDSPMRKEQCYAQLFGIEGPWVEYVKVRAEFLRLDRMERINDYCENAILTDTELKAFKEKSNPWNSHPAVSDWYAERLSGENIERELKKHAKDYDPHIIDNCVADIKQL